MTKKLKVGVIGIGNIARWHMSGWEASTQTSGMSIGQITRIRLSTGKSE